MACVSAGAAFDERIAGCLAARVAGALRAGRELIRACWRLSALDGIHRAKIVDVSHSLLVQEVGVESLLVGSFLRLVDVVEAERLITNKSNYECLERFLVLSTRSLHPSLLLLLFL